MINVAITRNLCFYLRLTFENIYTIIKHLFSLYIEDMIGKSDKYVIYTIFLMKLHDDVDRGIINNENLFVSSMSKFIVFFVCIFPERYRKCMHLNVSACLNNCFIFFSSWTSLSACLSNSLLLFPRGKKRRFGIEVYFLLIYILLCFY